LSSLTSDLARLCRVGYTPVLIYSKGNSIMASISKDSNGNRTVQFVGADGKRRSIRLGKVNAKNAESLKIRVETLASAVAARLPLDSETAAWLGNIGDELAAKLAAVGLIPVRQNATLGAFLEEYITRNAHEWKPGTLTQVKQRCNNLFDAFGPQRDLRTITSIEAETYKLSQQSKGLADATLHRRFRAYRTMFADAVRRKLLVNNPFAEVHCREGDVTKRQFYVSVDSINRILDEAKPCWRTIVALARFAGLRTPSETLMLRWDCVNLVTGRMVIESSKTDERVMPIIASLRPYLEESFELAPPGTIYVVHGPDADMYRATSKTGRGWVATNIRTGFLRLIRRSGVSTWPRPFQNLRSSCETDLNAEFPGHVVAKWIGHSMAVAEKHYLQVRDTDFSRAVKYQLPVENAVHKAVQTPADKTGNDETSSVRGSAKQLESVLMSQPVSQSPYQQITRQGFEP